MISQKYPPPLSSQALGRVEGSQILQCMWMLPSQRWDSILCLTLACFSFCLWQDQFDMVSDADLQGLDAKIVALTAKVQSLQQSCRHMEAGRTGQPPGGGP